MTSLVALSPVFVRSFGEFAMKRYVVACVISGVVGLAVGGRLIDGSSAGGLWAEARAGQAAAGAVVRSERTPSSPETRHFSSEEQQNIYVYEVANPSVVNISTRSVVYDGFFG